MAFTLLELIITIAIMVVVMALLLPALNTARGRAVQASCLGNIRQYGVAVMTFATDKGGLPDTSDDKVLPRFSQWLTPYLPVQPRCPAGSAKDKPIRSDKTPDYGFNYAGNISLCENFPTLKNIPAPSSKVVLAAETYQYNYFQRHFHLNRTIWGNDNGGVNPDDEGSERKAQFHGSRSNRGLHFFFLDGHAELVQPVDNDWTKAPIHGDKTNGGYFYDTNQFSSMKRGNLIVN